MWSATTPVEVLQQAQTVTKRMWIKGIWMIVQCFSQPNGTRRGAGEAVPPHQPGQPRPHPVHPQSDGHHGRSPGPHLPLHPAAALVRPLPWGERPMAFDHERHPYCRVGVKQ